MKSIDTSSKISDYYYLEIEHFANAGVEFDTHHVVIEDITSEDTVCCVCREEIRLPMQ